MPDASDDLPNLDDVIGPGLRLLLVGINPSVLSARRNRHFARPGNRFWPALSASGLLPRPFGPDDQHLLPAHGIGITNLVARPTVRADEVTAEELHAGAEALVTTVHALGDPVVGVLGVTAYRIAFREPRASRGPQPGRPAWWVLDNPSGLNSRAQIPVVAAQLAEVGAAAGLPDR